MSSILDMFERMNIRAGKEISSHESEMKETVNAFKAFADEIRKQLLQTEMNCNKPYKTSRSSKRLAETSSSEEEADVSSTRVKLHNAPENVENTSAKPRRGAAKAASANIKKVSNMKLNSKMRRPSNEENNQSSVFEFNPCFVKIEKLSESKSSALSDVTNENMPPPTSKPKRGRKKVKKETDDSDVSVTKTAKRVTRSTRSKTKDQSSESAKSTRATKNLSISPHRKDSDVLIQEVPIAVVVVTDSESETDKPNEIEDEKTKRGKKGKKPTQNKMKLKIKEEKPALEEKPAQEEVKNNTQNSLQEVSVYEDAVSEKTLDDNPPQTKIKETKLNCTVQLETMRSTFTVNQPNEKLDETKILTAKPNACNLLTDDDDSIEVSAPLKTPNKKQPVKTKQIFSPYGNSPVKKRVAAFEKLGTADVPARVTRTKTRNLAAAEKSQASPVNNPPATASKTKKVFTPASNNKLPTMIPQLDSKQKINKNTSVVSSDSVKSLTAVKASRAELQERREEEQKRKLKHENEVKQKKEAMLQAKIEEQKRKREEKQMKAQKAREAKDREKEEKIRRVIQEKEEKLQKEEQMKREWMKTMAKKAAEEEKHQQMLKQEKLEQKRKLNKKPPPLPTDDLQDSDEEDENPKSKYVGPIWSQRQNLYPTLYTQRFVPTAITKEFFQMQAQTPDLLEIFETVSADILRRNSSAVWRTPPRHSTLPKF